MRLAKAWCWIILLVGCGGRVQIGHDLPDASKPPTDSDAATGTGGASGQGGSGAVAGSAGIAGSGGTAGSSAAGGAGGAGATGGAGGIAGAGVGGAGGTSGDGGAIGSGGAGPGGSAGSAGAAGAGGSGPSADASRIPPWPGPTQCPPYAPSPLIGQWVGHIENYQFPSGSNLVHLFIEGADDTSFCGSVTFGVAPLPPPATNPDVGYPPDVNIQLLRNTAWRVPYEGFNYRIQEAIVSGNNFRFQVLVNELWKSWCVLQTSHPTHENLPYPPYRCVASGTAQTSSEAGADGRTECALVDPSNQRTVLDCDKLSLCVGPRLPNSVGPGDSVCECNAVGCNGHPWQAHFVSGAVEGNRMTALFNGRGGPAYNVELVRN